MNDFTKGELEELYEILDMQGACRLLYLKAEIKRMIENYCEHIWNATRYDYVISCKICGKITSSDS